MSTSSFTNLHSSRKIFCQNTKLSSRYTGLCRSNWSTNLVLTIETRCDGTSANIVALYPVADDYYLLTSAPTKHDRPAHFKPCESCSTKNQTHFQLPAQVYFHLNI